MSSSEIANLKNLGPKSAEMLEQAGIHTTNQIRKLGSIGTFLFVKQTDPKVSLNLLWALEGYLKDKDWRDLSDIEKSDLLSELE